ncbi:response regulator [Desulfopila inferna]|uniref:response regulator n=1 Tax=Desulfopila inferna TaxID=468528 RepID=UPI00196416DB|nr:response regulator [Desulfopila inferna]MBM9606047.1 response regulator [Desulfopila inferna]
MKKILYIEDDHSLRQLIKFIINNRDDLHLLEAETGAAGLQLALQEAPDIILLDLSLPDISGYDILLKLHNTEATAEIPVIAMSGDSLPEDIEKGLRAGFRGYLTKPVDIKKFYATLDAALK